MKIKKIHGMSLGDVCLQTLRMHCATTECLRCCFYDVHTTKCHFELRPCNWNTNELIEIEGNDKNEKD